MKISELMDGIRKRDLVLPEFQREFVWTRDQAKQLMSSLMKGYPVGSLLFWKTDDPPDLKNLSNIPDKLGTISVILDGQQRLTTLYLLVEGQIPPYYTDADITNDPRGLYFNLETGELQYYQKTRMEGNPLWWKVTECFTRENKQDVHGEDADINVFEIAEQTADAVRSPFQVAQLYSKNLNRLRGIRSVDLPAQTVPPSASIDDAIDIFDLVNSQGTKLTDAELALTHVTGKWPYARRDMKAKIAELDEHNFYFDLTFMTRALTGVVTNRALFESIHNEPQDKLVTGWDQLTKILNYLVSVLPGNAFVHSTEDLNTTNVLIPLVVFLSIHDNHFPDESVMLHAVQWLYAAHTWARYTSQTDQRLEHDVSLIVREPQPWNALREQIIDQRGRIEVTANDFEGRGIVHPLFKMTYILAKAHGAVDWFNGAPLGTTHGSQYRIHNHHIFPSALLYKNGFDRDNHLHRKIVNEIANRAVLTADTNWDLSDTPPEEYLPVVHERYPRALSAQFIPMDPALWQVNRFEDFLQVRRTLIAQKLNEFMASLITKPEPTIDRSVKELIGLGESKTLEFKSTLQWDVIRNQMNKDLRYSVLKTIAAFLNSEGGTLVIGVEDTGDIFGLENDLVLVKGGSLDGFEQLLTTLVYDRIGGQFAPYVKVRFEEINGSVVCVVAVDKASEPAFTDTPKGRDFYVRMGNTTRTLDPQEMLSYVNTNWD